MENFEKVVDAVFDKIVDKHIKLLMLGLEYAEDFMEAKENGEVYYSVAEFMDVEVMKKYNMESYEAQEFLVSVKNDMLSMIKDLICGALGDVMGEILFGYLTSNIKFYGKIRTDEFWTLEMGNKAADTYRAKYKEVEEREKMKNEFKAI